MAPNLTRYSPPQKPKPKIVIDIGKAGFIFFLAIYGFRGAMDYDNFLFIHNFNLIIHEAGHAIFRILGEFIMFLGGTLLQLIVPITFTIYFFIRQERYSGRLHYFGYRLIYLMYLAI